MVVNNIEFLGILVNEPGTLISDLLMGFACLFFHFKLASKAVTKQQKHLSFFFFFLCISSIIAAFGHGFNYIFGMVFHILSWTCAGIAIYFILSGSSGMIGNRNLRSAYKVFNIFNLSLLILILLISPSFMLVKISLAFSLLGILLPLYITDTIRNSYTTNLYIFLGLCVACLPAVYHTVDFEFGYIFNMNDLSHFILIFCFYFIYLGIEKRFFSLYRPIEVVNEMEREELLNVEIK